MIELLVLFVVYLSPIMGYFIKTKTRKEIRSGKKYLLLLRNIMFAVIIVYASFKISWLILLFLLGFEYARRTKFTEHKLYLIIGLVLGIALKMGSFVELAILSFVFGLPVGSLSRRRFFTMALPVFIAVIFYFI